MARKDRMSGNEAVSYAIRQINPDVMPAFPITPSTEIPQMVSTYIDVYKRQVLERSYPQDYLAQMPVWYRILELFLQEPAG